MTTEQNGTRKKEGRKPRRRSLYMFPVYDFGMARRIAEKVEKDGAGNLSEETLAIALHLSAKSSGFQLKTLTARQFGLLTKQGQILSTTPAAKAIFKPTNEDEKRQAMINSFLAIPLFREVAARFRGQPLPQGQALRNILEREFSIDSKRVSDAERVLMDSARETGILVTSGSNIYLSTERVLAEKPPIEDIAEQTIHVPTVSSRKEALPSSSDGKTLPTIGEEDLLELEDEKFKQFWSVYGDILRSRARRDKAQRQASAKAEDKE